MEGAYLPGNIRQRMQELMKEHKITQAQLATRIGSTDPHRQHRKRYQPVCERQDR